ncbi:ImmA/IrrE family metallo-endopeptidase [Lysinibacillus pakistanensis]|uniref:ImmA/IrrE family metallo-endopeptidase n=1 Tax=Lysinibacillus pakistanensis TaxID=759811 RepID=UPI003D2AF974
MMKTSPNYNKARLLATKALAEHNIHDFPIDMISVFSSYSDVKVLKYSEMAKKRNCSVEEIIEINSSEDGVIHYCGKRKKYMVIYNDTVATKERVYWTLAHEFGHYILKHHEESNRSSLTRNTMADVEYDIYEVEANFFARFFITPPSIILAANMNDSEKISSYFGVSYTAANNTRKYIVESLRKGISFGIPDILKKCYSIFAQRINYGKTCIKCNSYFEIKNLKRCTICNGTVFNKYKKGENPMTKYPSIVEVDFKGRAKTCPRCKNEELDYEGDYCNVCSAYLVNECSHIYGYDESKRAEIIEKESCGTKLSGNARYCHNCGKPSTFLSNSYLKEWDYDPDALPF